MTISEFIKEQKDFPTHFLQSIESSLTLLDEIEAVNILQKEIKVQDIPDTFHILIRVINHLWNENELIKEVNQ